MSSPPVIRESSAQDQRALRALYPAAFPDEDLLPLVEELLDRREDVLSLVAEHDGNPLGNAVFTICKVEGSQDSVALLGPVAVDPTQQRQGIGQQLIRAGHELLKTRGIGTVLVLGDPAYYGQFGFTSEAGIRPPYPMPEEWNDAWQSLALLPDAPALAGHLIVLEPWRKAVLWGP